MPTNNMFKLAGFAPRGFEKSNTIARCPYMVEIELNHLEGRASGKLMNVRVYFEEGTEIVNIKKTCISVEGYIVPYCTRSGKPYPLLLATSWVTLEDAYTQKELTAFSQIANLGGDNQ